MEREGFLRGFLKGYYSSVVLDSVPDIASREFGFGELGKKISGRHLAFSSPKELNSFLRERAPFYISYSAARYEFPVARPMEAKSLVGADLIWEFDADDIQTDCKASHDSWKCKSCGASGKGNIEQCTECGMGVSVDEWVCPECISETKKQTQKLLGILRNDFGFSGDVPINFSGSKGFHVHYRGQEIQGLSKKARLELLDFITGANMDLKALGFFFEKKKFSCPAYSRSRGWAKKILSNVRAAIDANDSSLLAVMGATTVRTAKKIIAEKDSVFSAMERGNLLSAPGVKAEKFWQSALSYAADSEVLGVDRQTSVDINKIIRVPSTIHGSTGLLAMPVIEAELAGFDALSESVVLPSHGVKVVNVSAPRFYVGGNWLGPYSSSEEELPAYAAFYLLSRGRADLG
ncbi:MAG: hypothetical protein NUV67_04385 [archaeon]|nr:hypothetical protein [archaeon]